MLTEQNDEEMMKEPLDDETSHEYYFVSKLKTIYLIKDQPTFLV